MPGGVLERLAGRLDEAAEGDRADREAGFTPGEAHEFGAEAEREALDAHTELFADEEMPSLVQEDHEAKGEDDGDGG